MTMRHVVIVLLALALGRPVSAQPAGALGKPLASADLPVGTVSVRVIDGAITAPRAGIAVWLDVDGTARTATADAMGRAVFAGVPVGANVTAAIAPAAGSPVRSERFVVPSFGGTRVLLSTRPLADPQPRPRSFSGKPRPVDGTAPGSLDVRLTYDDVADPKPPSKLPVTVVGYRVDGTVATMTQPTDQGSAQFVGLDHSGAVAYYVVATLPRNGSVDRLIAAPIVLDDTAGVRVALSADDRAAKTPPIDDLDDAQPSASTPRGKLHVQLDGLSEPGAPISVVDATTGKQVARGTTADTDATIDVGRAGQVLYVDALVRGEHYRSRPFQTVADRGARIAVAVYPRLMSQFSMIAEPVGAAVVTWGQFSVQNNSWIPSPPVAVPLPKGFGKPVFADDDRALASFTSTGFVFARPLAPGEQRVRARFELPAAGDGKVRWDLDLPLGTFQSNFRIVDEPGVAVVAPNAAVARADFDGESYLAISEITIKPKQAMVMSIDLPKLTPGQLAVARACQPLEPDRKTALRGKPMPDFTAPQLDGKKLRLGSLRGKLILVNFMATWDMLSGKERPTFAPLAGGLGAALAIVLVASDADPTAVVAKIGPNPPFRIVLDPSTKPTDNIGPITTSWGVHLLPESFLVDKHGVVRLYFSNSRDWSTPDALACLKAVARD